MITRAVVPAAGLGTRLLPVTRSVPKELLPVVDRPVVDYVIAELATAGIEQVLLVTSPRKYAIEDHFDHDPADGGPVISYVHQPRAVGLGDAVRHGAGFAGTTGAVVALGDAIIEQPSDGSPGIVRRLLEAYDRSGATAALAVTEVAATDVSRYGIVVAEGDGPVLAVQEIVEKPDPGSVPSRLAWPAAHLEVEPDSELVRATVLRLARVTDPAAHRTRVQWRTAIPRHVGLGGSSAIVIATLRATRSLHGIDLPEPELAELALAVEVEDLGIAAGLQDRVAQAYGGLTFMEFAPGAGETAYERLDPSLLPPLLVAWQSSAAAESGSVHAPLRDAMRAASRWSCSRWPSWVSWPAAPAPP